MSEIDTAKAEAFTLQPGVSGLDYGKRLVASYHLYPVEGGPLHQLPSTSKGDRRIPAASAGHCTTHAVFGKGAGRHTQGESWTELRLQYLVNAKSNVVDLREQALFKYGWKGERKHFFDILLTLDCGSRIACTVKPEERLVSGRFLKEMGEIAWWVDKLCFADETRLLTDADIDPVELHNARIFASLRESDPVADLAAQAAIAPMPDGACRALRDLVRETGLAARGYRALLRLLRDGHLVLSKRQAIGPAALVMRSSGMGAAEGWSPISPMLVSSAYPI